MSDFNALGYEDLRTAVTNRWSHIALIDDAGNEVTRIDIANDSRTSWGDPSTNPVDLSVTITGADSDIPTPTEFSGSSLHTSDSSSATHDDNFEGANVIIDDNDQLELTHSVELPQV
jgi:hypothetical protein